MAGGRACPTTQRGDRLPHLLGSQFDLLPRKFEPERLGVELFLAATARCGDIGFGCVVEAGLNSLEPGLLQSLESGQVLFGLTPQAALLSAEIDELALVRKKGLGLYQYLARAFVVFGEQVAKFHPA